MRPPWSILLPAVALAAAAAALACAPRMPWTPTPAECLASDRGGALRWQLAPWCALAAAASVALVARSGRRGAQAGGFGAAAAVVLAGGVPLLGVTRPLPAWAMALSVPVAVAVAARLMPLLRDRALWSLALATLLAAPAYVLTWRAARTGAHGAAPLDAVARVLASETAVALELDPVVTDEQALALAARLRPPFAARATDVLAARRDAMTARWLQRLGLPRYRWDGIRCEPLPLAPASPPLAAGSLEVRAALARGADGGVEAVSITCPAAHTGWVAAVFSAAGSGVLRFAEDGRARIDGADPGAQRWLRAMASGAPIRILVVPPASADVYGWTELRP